MRPDVQRDYDWQRRFIPQMKSIVGAHLVDEAPPTEDTERNTDLIVLRLEAVRVGCRVRQFRYLSNYGDQFTIRLERPSGVKTELGKIAEGWGDYLLYGFSDETERELCRWSLLSLHVFRSWLFWHMARNAGRLPGEIRVNVDGTKFLAVDIPTAPSALVVAREFAYQSVFA